MPWAQINPVIDEGVRGLCSQPYPNHKKGCPNFGKKAGCPPQAPLLGDFFDLSEPVYAVWNEYDFKVHTDKMRAAHPLWSQRQVECCLYWQGTARKSLKGHIEIFQRRFGFTSETTTTCPEAMGANITATMKQIGIELEWPPVNKTYQVAFAGTRKG